jgi:L-ribulose-5-phosphate 3-epimerase
MSTMNGKSFQDGWRHKPMRFGAMQLILAEDGSNINVPDSFRIAQEAGYDGIELFVSTMNRTDQSIWTESGREILRRLSEQYSLTITSLALGFLSRGGLKSPDESVRQMMIDAVLQVISIAPKFGLHLLLIPFFGSCEIETPEDKQRVVESLKQLAPAAEVHHLILGLESTLSAEEHLDIIEQVGSPSVKIYYDVSNATYWKHNPPSELKRLGRHIAQIHFKDGKQSHSDAMIGEGNVDWTGVMEAIRLIGYRQWNPWIIIESTLPPRKPLVQSAADNLRRAKSLFGL